MTPSGCFNSGANRDNGESPRKTRMRAKRISHIKETKRAKMKPAKRQEFPRDPRMVAPGLRRRTRCLAQRLTRRLLRDWYVTFPPSASAARTGDSQGV